MCSSLGYFQVHCSKRRGSTVCFNILQANPLKYLEDLRPVIDRSRIIADSGCRRRVKQPSISDFLLSSNSGKILRPCVICFEFAQSQEEEQAQKSCLFTERTGRRYAFSLLCNCMSLHDSQLPKHRSIHLIACAFFSLSGQN
jgi:hypothetical protein